MAILLDLAMADGIIAGNEQKIDTPGLHGKVRYLRALKPVIDSIIVQVLASIFGFPPAMVRTVPGDRPAPLRPLPYSMH